jgi:ribosomal protein L37AE/L43A
MTATSKSINPKQSPATPQSRISHEPELVLRQITTFVYMGHEMHWIDLPRILKCDRCGRKPNKFITTPAWMCEFCAHWNGAELPGHECQQCLDREIMRIEIEKESSIPQIPEPWVCDRCGTLHIGGATE